MKVERFPAGDNGARFAVSKLVRGVTLLLWYGVAALHQGAGQARFTTLVKEGWDRLCHAIAFNIKRSYLAGVRKPVPVPAI